jgi:methylmalonyl-CoA/ethylmalonyl-CoA epimerase
MSLFTRVDHIGIAVRSLDQAIPLYRDTLGLHLELIDQVDSQGVRVAFFACGETLIELLEPTRADSPIATFIEKRGEGVHHIALATDSLAEARELAIARRLRLLSEAPIDGAHGKIISFVHPKDMLGVLLEFCQRKPDAH